MLLSQALPDLKARTGVEVLYTDGGYGGGQADESLQTHDVTLIQTAIRGRSPSHGHLRLSDFAFEGEPLEGGMSVTCPNGQTAGVNLSQRGKSYQADFCLEVCAACPLQEQCPSQEMRRERVRRLRFTAKEWQRAKRIRRSAQHQGKARNLRAAVEATIGSLKHPFPAGKLPVRGLFRVTCMVIGVAAVINVQRLHRYLQAKMAGERVGQEVQSWKNRSQREAEGSVFSFVRAVSQTFGLFGPSYRSVFNW